MLWFGLDTKKHLVRFRKTSCFSPKYLFWSPQKWLEMSELPVKNIHFFVSPMQLETVSRSISKYPVVSLLQMLNYLLKLLSLALPASLLHAYGYESL